MRDCLVGGRTSLQWMTMEHGLCFKKAGPEFFESPDVEEKNCGTDVIRLLNTCYVFTMG